MITIIIPYYQKESGILEKALTSISNQLPLSIPIHVIVVDDSSPLPADTEIKKITPIGYTLQVIRQENGGPGAARNKGLDNAPHETQYIAFLDSDDEWTRDHLLRATAALDEGYDFYFSDHYQLGSSIGAFSRAGRIRPLEHPQLTTPHTQLHAYQGSLMDQIIRGNVIGTSTVAYNFIRFQKIRFRTEFKNAGEDYLFWMDIASTGARTAFSSKSEATYGHGVNIYAGTGWGTPQHLLRIHNEIKYKKLIIKLFEINSDQKTKLNTDISELRTAFCRDLISRVKNKNKVSLILLLSHLSLDPKSYIKIPETFLKIIFNK